MPVQLCENVTPVTIFGNFCVILTLLKKKVGRRAAEFIVYSLRAQPHTERRRAACRFRYLVPVEPKHKNGGRWAAQDVSSGAAEQGTNSFVSRSVYNRLTLFIFFFPLPWMLFDCQEYREPDSECTQKYHFFNYSKKYFVGRLLIERKRDGTLQTDSFV
jgi:hypothetical protein